MTPRPLPDPRPATLTGFALVIAAGLTAGAGLTWWGIKRWGHGSA